MLSSLRVFGGLLFAGALCLTVTAQTQEEMDAAARATLTSPEFKGTLVSRLTKEEWTTKDGRSRMVVYTIGDYELRIVNPNDSPLVLGVLKGGKVIYAAQSMDGNPIELLVEPTLGLDIDKDGATDAVVSSYSGGMHCCYSYQVLSFASEFRAGAMLDTGGSGLSLVPGSVPNVVFTASDGVLEYWHSDFASSIFPGVHVQFEGDKVTLADAWMKYPTPTDEEWAKMKADAAAAMASKENWMQSPENNEPPFAPRALIEQMVRLIYSGNGAHALKLLKETWKGDAAKPGIIATELFTQISKSQYWDSIKTMNGWTGEPAAIAQAGLAAK